MTHAELGPWLRLPGTPADVPGFFGFADLYARIVAEAPPGSTIVEVGCLCGKSLCGLATLARAANESLRVVGVDSGTGSPDPNDLAGVGLAAALGGSFAGLLSRNINVLGLADVVTLVIGDSSRAADMFADGSVFAAFLDGSHLEEDVYRDLESWYPKIRPGGIIAGDDIRHSRFPGVAVAVERFFGPGDYTDPDSPSCWSVKKA